MRAAVFIFLLSLAAAAAQFGLRSPVFVAALQGPAAAVPSVDVLLDFEASSVGLFTTNRLFDGAHTNGNVGYWNITPDPQVQNFVTNDTGIPFIAPVSVASVTYSASAQSGYFAMATTAAFHDGRFYFACRQGQMGVSFFFQLGANNKLSDYIDLVQLEASGEYAVADIVTDNPPIICVHSNTNFGSVGASITITTNFFYYVNMSWDTNTGPTGYSVLELRNTAPTAPTSAAAPSAIRTSG